MLAAVLVASSMAVAQAPPSGGLPEGADFESGRQQYHRTCAQCHGRNMVNSGTTIYDLRRFPPDQPERFFQSITKGKGNMPSFQDALSAEQMNALWFYVRNQGVEPTALRVCMAEENAPLSYRQGREPRGLDASLAKAIAAEAGRALKVVFFESEYDRDKTLAQEVNAMLSSGVCDLASGYALFASDLGAPGRAEARTPDYEGAKPRRQRAFVPLQRLAATRAYIAAAMGVVTRDPALRVDTLADLQNVKIGVVTGTMAGSALALYRNGALLAGLVTLSQREDLLAALEAGRFEATLTALTRFDAYRLAHRDTRITRAKYVHPLRINMGFVGLEAEPAVIAAGSRLIGRALANGELARWAGEAGVTWIAPEPPDVQPAFGLGSLRTD